MAEGILRTRAAEAGISVSVGSAGILPGGSPATPDGVAVLAGMGIDISDHVSRRLNRDLVTEADLVVCMTREHLREAVVADPGSFPKIFTLKELVRRLEQTPGASMPALAAGRKTADYMRNDPADDVADPIGQPRAKYEATAAELDNLLTTLVKNLETL